MGNCWSRRTRHSRRGSSGSLVVNIPLAQLSQSSGNPSVDQPPPVPPRTSSRGQHQQSIRNVPADQPSPPPCDASKVQPPPSPPGTPSGGHQHQHQPTRSLGARNRQIKEHWQIVYPVHNFEGEVTLEDTHIWDLAKSITSKQQLRDLALNILKIPAKRVDSALYNEREIQDAALVVLKTWQQGQNNRQEAYRNLYTALYNNGWKLLAGELKQWVEGTTARSPFSETQFADLQNRVKNYLESSLRDCLKHDWLEDGHTFPLMQYYTDLVWTRMVKEAIGWKGKTMKGLEEILEVPGAGEKCLKILVVAKPGMGKSSSMAMLAMKWVTDRTGEFPFDFVFLITLRNVDQNCSLAELVADEHDLEKEEIKLVESILTGNTKHRVLLLIDGYDEYTPGTNTELDRAIEKTIGKCFLILTSRPKENKDFTKSIRNKTDGEVVIQGFSEENILKCCSLYLGSVIDVEQFLEEAKKKADLYELLHVPIILLMTSVLYNEGDKKSLPERRTELYENLFEFIMDRSTLKKHNFGCYSSEVPNLQDMLQILGKFSWEALQNDVRQLLINKTALEKECPDIMKLGLLHEVSKKKATAKTQPAFLSYEHKSLQDFGASKFVTKRLETAKNMKETLKELFPSWEAVQRYREVVIFVAGLMKDSRPLVQHLYEMQIEDSLNGMRTHVGVIAESIDTDLLKWLQAESIVRLFDHPLHNKYINYYNHSNDDMNARPRDTTPVKTLSKLYVFSYLREDIACNIELADQGAETPQCAVRIESSDRVGCLSVICRTIWYYQKVSDLYTWDVSFLDFRDVPIRSEEPRLVYLDGRYFPNDFVEKIRRQLFDCGESLQKLWLRQINFASLEPLLDELLEDLVAHHEAGLAQRKLVLLLKGHFYIERTHLSWEFVKKWMNRCEKVDSIYCEIPGYR